MQYKNYEIKTVQDFDPESPRDWDNLGTMALFHNQYGLGDKDHGFSSSSYHSWDEMEADICRKKDIAVILPVYMYDHSGITINTTGFSCPWDSGQVGFIWISKDEARKEYGWKVVNQKRKDELKKYLVSEVNTYDLYLNGEVYGYEVTDSEGKHIDSCYGFYGDPEESGLMEQAKSAVDCDLSSIGEQLELKLA